MHSLEVDLIQPFSTRLNPPGYDVTRGARKCRDVVPQTRLAYAYASSSIPSGLPFDDRCLNDNALYSGDGMYAFIRNFFIPTKDLANVIKAAAYMSHEIWLSASESGQGSRSIFFGVGVDFQKPGLTKNMIIGLSFAIKIFLLSLLMLAFYASLSRTWAPSLHAFAALRIGAQLGRDVVPFLAVQDVDQ